MTTTPGADLPESAPATEPMSDPTDPHMWHEEIRDAFVTALGVQVRA